MQNSLAIFSIITLTDKQTVHTHYASVHQAAKLVTALLMVAGVTAGLVESNGSLPSGIWFTSPAGWLPIRLLNPTIGNRVRATFFNDKHFKLTAWNTTNKTGMLTPIMACSTNIQAIQTYRQTWLEMTRSQLLTGCNNITHSKLKQANETQRRIY